MKKSGFTLVELMVYIGIVGVVVIVAGQAFSNSTKMRVRTESMIKANATVEEAGMLMQEDVAQMGAKSALVTNNYDRSDETFESSIVYMDASGGDSSSYTISSQDGRNSNLVMRRMRYGEDGSYESVEEVEWFVNDGKLYRKCKTLQSSLATVSDDCPIASSSVVEMTDNVASFNVIPALPSVLESDYDNIGENSPRLLPSPDRNASTFRLVARQEANRFETLVRQPQMGGRSVTLSGFSTNYNFETQAPQEAYIANQLYLAAGAVSYVENANSWQTLCTRVDLDAGEEYELSFRVPFVADDNSRSFCPGVDHMAVGFRNVENGSPVEDLPDFAFYPALSNKAESRRSVRFSVKTAKKDLCLAFTFAMYSPTAPSGTITISDVSLNKVESSHFVFDASKTIQVVDKKNVKAMKLILKLNRGNESGNLSLVIPVPSNGKN